MPDAARDGKHAVGVAKGTAAQNKNPGKSHPSDNKSSTGEDYSGKHRKD